MSEGCVSNVSCRMSNVSDGCVSNVSCRMSNVLLGWPVRCVQELVSNALAWWWPILKTGT